jgi:hypothetical protein
MAKNFEQPTIYGLDYSNKELDYVRYYCCAFGEYPTAMSLEQVKVALIMYQRNLYKVGGYYDRTR